MISVPILRRLLQYCTGRQVSRDAVATLRQLNDELLQTVACRIGDGTEDGRVTVEDVVAAWSELVKYPKDHDAHGGGPPTAFVSPTTCFSGPPSTENPTHIYPDNP